MARPSRYSSSVIQRFSGVSTRRIQKFTPPKPEAPMRAKVRKISVALRGTTDALFDRVEDHVRQHHEDRDEQRPAEKAEARKHAHRARAPDRRRGVEAADGAVAVPDQSRADEADTDDHLADDARRPRVVAESRAGHA